MRPDQRWDRSDDPSGDTLHVAMWMPGGAKMYSDDGHRPLIRAVHARWTRNNPQVINQRFSGKPC